MRRLAATALVLVALAAAPASAGGAARFTDAKGDWQVDTQDVTAGRISSALVHGKPVLRGELTLAAAPGATSVPGMYALGGTIGCQEYAFLYEWQPTGYTAGLARYDFCTGRDVSDVSPDQMFPATAVVKGTTIVFEAPYTRDVRKGAKLGGLYAGACPANYCLSVFLDAEHTLVGDLALTDLTYVVGSDLPRR